MLISNVLKVTNNDHVMAADCARAASGPGLYWRTPCGSPHAEPGWPGPDMQAIFLLSSRMVLVGPSGLPQLGERLFCVCEIYYVPISSRSQSSVVRVITAYASA